MKKTDLYRGFDSIRPSKELKAEILKAVKERDKVTVIKRPLFVPIMVGMLVCLNFGMVAKLVICNKSQINMADLKARTSISQAPEASQEDFVLIEDTRTSEFQSAVDELQEGIDNGEYSLVYEWKDNKLITPSQTWPYYLTNNWQADYKEDYENLSESENYLYRRFAKKRTIMVNYESDSPTDYNLTCLTNDEVIVGYKGECTPDNIISITQSNVDTSAVSDSQLAESLKRLNTNEAVSNSLENYVFERSEGYAAEKRIIAQNYGTDSNMCIYPVKSSENEAKIVQCCYLKMSTSNEIKMSGNEVDVRFLITEEGNIISTETDYKSIPSDPEEYWKETLFRPGILGNEMVQIPDVIGMDIDNAKKTLEDAGLKFRTFRYDAPYSVVYKYEQVMDINCWTGEDWRKVNDLVPKGSEVDVVICAESAVWPK